jgi:hypothetical protein
VQEVLKACNGRSKHRSTSFKNAVKLGAWLGLKWTLYIFGPFFLIAFIFTIGMWVFRFSFWEETAIFADPALRKEMLESIGACFAVRLIMCFWGMIAGLLVTVPMYLISLAREKLFTGGE